MPFAYELGRRPVQVAHPLSLTSGVPLPSAGAIRPPAPGIAPGTGHVAPGRAGRVPRPGVRLRARPGNRPGPVRRPGSACSAMCARYDMDMQVSNGVLVGGHDRLVSFLSRGDRAENAAAHAAKITSP